MKLKSVIRRIVFGRPNEFSDVKLRAQFERDYGIRVGLYSYGCFDRARIDPNTTIGRYCSFAPTAQVFNRNHGMNYIGTTPYFYNSSLGIVQKDAVEYETCEIGDDVWIGHNASILPSARKIGRGAVIAAGALVTRDVPPYAVVAGSPAKVVKFRFDDDTIKKIEESGWWLWDLSELRRRVAEGDEMIFAPDRYFRGR